MRNDAHPGRCCVVFRFYTALLIVVATVREELVFLCEVYDTIAVSGILAKVFQESPAGPSIITDILVHTPNIAIVSYT